jgi:hypothetical protein
MASFFVGGGRVRGTVSLDENEPGRIILLLKEVEPGDARLFHTFAGVSQGGRSESFDVFGFYVNLYKNDEHMLSLYG